MSESRNVMVCVTQQKTCERLIKRGYNELKTDKDKLYVIHVVNEKDKFLENWSDEEALEYLFSVSKKVGADLTVLRSKDIVKAIADFAIKNKISHIVMGVSPDGKGIENHSLAMKLNKKLPEADFLII
ncbi:universal stress protein [Caldisalinibacter kiritimatiensis]|uniref:UspA n=1 Tax=Caldisalinibacter kiritimatiensis TaxID=1304284 RepID=R1CV52_9FIRM|nr:universal stress protein [Caldisalinibacter kiritimatiensis]EOD00504.1 UspA [Caldisalinibacter kiritimatiensis]